MSLVQIQAELKVPKGQYNNFGGFRYRSCEDIVESVKPILFKYDSFLKLSDEIVEVGGRIYVKATATIYCGSKEYTATGYAREQESKKGMDESQITGTASSYARKYALGGLLAIDDTKDADTMDNGSVPAKPKNAARSLCDKLKDLCVDNQLDYEETKVKIIEQFTRDTDEEYRKIEDILAIPQNREKIKKSIYEGEYR